MSSAQPSNGFTRVCLGDAVRLARSVLARGSLIAFELDYQLGCFDIALIIDHPALTREFSGHPGTYTRDQADNELDAHHALLLASMPAARAIVVEDSYALRSDPNRSGCAYADERVVRWRLIDHSQPGGVELLRAGAHGVPLCAYITTRSAGELGLVEGVSLSSESMGSIAESTIAVVLPLFDEEAFLALCRIGSESVDAR